MSAAQSKATSFNLLESANLEIASSASLEISLKRVSSKESSSQEAPSIQEQTVEEQEIQQALELLLAGDFHSRWDKSKRFVKRFQSDRPIPFLIQALQSSTEPEYQWFLIRILGEYDQPIVVERLAHFLVSTPEAELQAEVIRALTRLGNSAIATLSQQLQSNHLPQRRLAARALSHIRRSHVIEPLLSIVRDADSQLRLIAIEALGSFHDARITPVLISALTDEDAITTEAVRALGRRSDLLDTYDLIKLLQKCMTQRSEAIAKESATALGRLGTEEAAVALGSVLTQPAPTAVKVAAVRALSWTDSAIAMAYLATAFEYKPPVVMPTLKREIAKALGQARTPANKFTAAKPLVGWLQQYVSNASSEELTETIKQETTKHETSEHETSEPNIHTPDLFALKQTVVSSITWLGAMEATESLIPLLADEDVRIQMHALSALKRIAPREAKARVTDYASAPELSSVVKSKIARHLDTWR